MRTIIVSILFILISVRLVDGKYVTLKGCPVIDYFPKTLREWYGLGFRYAVTAQTIDYSIDAGNYGEFCVIDKKSREKKIDPVFGENVLSPGMTNMFIDTLNQVNPGATCKQVKSAGNIRMDKN